MVVIWDLTMISLFLLLLFFLKADVENKKPNCTANIRYEDSSLKKAYCSNDEESEVSARQVQPSDNMSFIQEYYSKAVPLSSCNGGFILVLLMVLMAAVRARRGRYPSMEQGFLEELENEGPLPDGSVLLFAFLFDRSLRLRTVERIAHVRKPPALTAFLLTCWLRSQGFNIVEQPTIAATAVQRSGPRDGLPRTGWLGFLALKFYYNGAFHNEIVPQFYGQLKGIMAHEMLRPGNRLFADSFCHLPVDTPKQVHAKVQVVLQALQNSFRIGILESGVFLVS